MGLSLGGTVPIVGCHVVVESGHGEVTFPFSLDCPILALPNLLGYRGNWGRVGEHLPVLVVTYE